MSKGKIPFICDYCGKNRGDDTNHWVYLYIETEDADDKVSQEVGVVPEIRVGALNIADDPNDCPETEKHACGEQCAVKLFQIFLRTGGLEDVKSVKEAI